MKLKRIAVFAVAGIVSVALIGCGNGGEKKASTAAAAAGDQVIIKIGGTVAEDHPITIGQRAFIEKLEEVSGGKMTGNLYPNGQLGTGRELMEAVQAGDLQMGETTVATSANFTDQLAVLQLPFLYPSREVAYAFAKTETSKKYEELLERDTGVKICGWYENGFRQLTNNVKAVTTPDDMKGLKIRVMETPIMIKTFETLGAAATPMAFSEVYTALQQGTVDGQDNPYAITTTNKYYEVQKYMTDLQHCFDYTMLIVNADFYNSLTDEQKAWFDEAAEYSTEIQHQASIEKEDGFKKEIDDYGNCQLTQLTDEQRNAFKEKIQPVYDWFTKEYEGKLEVTLEDVQKEIAEIEASLS